MDGDLSITEVFDPTFGPDRHVAQIRIGLANEAGSVTPAQLNEYEAALKQVDPAVRFWATPPVHGVLRPSVVHPALFTFKLPDNVSFAEAAKLLMVSFDSTLRANLSVGMPLDMLFYERDSLDVGFEMRIGADDAYFRSISEGWSTALRSAFASLPDFPYDKPPQP